MNMQVASDQIRQDELFALHKKAVKAGTCVSLEDMRRDRWFQTTKEESGAINEHYATCDLCCDVARMFY